MTSTTQPNSSEVSIVVVGGGAMGGLFASRLALGGSTVTVVDTDPATVAAIERSGIQLTHQGETQTASVSVVADGRSLDPADLVLFQVKAQHTIVAARNVATALGPNTTVATLQNGWGNADRLIEAGVDPALVVAGVTYHSATLTGPGLVNHTGAGDTFIGPLFNGATIDRAEKMASLFTSSGLPTVASVDVRTEIWKKLVLNASVLAVSALTLLVAGKMEESDELMELINGVTTEVMSVVRAQGLDIDESERRDTISAVLRRAGSGRPSMLQDVLARRKTEIEVVNGAVVAAAREFGIEVPLNQALVALVHGLEESWK